MPIDAIVEEPAEVKKFKRKQEVQKEENRKKQEIVSKLKEENRLNKKENTRQEEAILQLQEEISKFTSKNEQHLVE